MAAINTGGSDTWGDDEEGLDESLNMMMDIVEAKLPT